MENTNNTRKISADDRYQAIRHSELYAEDYFYYLKEKERGNERERGIGIGNGSVLIPGLSKPAKKLCKKWNLSFPVKPIGLEPAKNNKIEENIQAKVDPPITFLDPPEKWDWKTVKGIGFVKNDKEIPSITIDGVKVLLKPDDPVNEDVEVYTHINGKLVLMINLDYSLNDLVKAFKNFLKKWERWSKPSSKRSKESSINIWQVYEERYYNKR